MLSQAGYINKYIQNKFMDNNKINKKKNINEFEILSKKPKTKIKKGGKKQNNMERIKSKHKKLDKIVGSKSDYQSLSDIKILINFIKDKKNNNIINILF